MCNEQTFLRASIAATVVVAAFGIILGLLSGSFSITFDGVYSLADAGMTVLALWVSRLIAVSATGDALSARMRDRFTMGFWHLEPIVLLLNGTLLMAIAVYALINALTSVLKGGHQLQFGFAIAYAAVTVFVCAMMAVIGARANRGLRSNFIALDVKAWIMSGGHRLGAAGCFHNRPCGPGNGIALDDVIRRSRGVSFCLHRHHPPADRYG